MSTISVSDLKKKPAKQWLKSVLVAEQLKRLGGDEKELPRRRKGDQQKVKPAGRLRRESTMSVKWIAKRLQMGGWTCVSNLLNEAPRS